VCVCVCVCVCVRHSEYLECIKALIHPLKIFHPLIIYSPYVMEKYTFFALQKKTTNFVLKRHEGE